MSGPELKLPPLPPFCSGPFAVNRATNWIEGVDAFGGPCHMLDVRGWGYLTGRGTALRLSDEVAIKAQRETAQWVVDAMNAAWNRRTPDPAQIRADALREAIWAAFIAGVGQGSEEATSYEWGTAPQQSRQQAFDDFMADWNEDSAYLRALLAPPLSPTAADGSPAPDDGMKGQDQ